MKILECKNLCVSYDGKRVLENVSFSLEAGDYLCVVGENGSGKSTLIKGLLGLKAPDSGSVSFGDGLKSSSIGYLPQQTQIQKDFPASVEEVVLSGCINSMGSRAHYGAKQRELAEMNMERMSIDSIKKPATMSFPAASSSGCCSRGRCARRAGCSCSMSLSPGLIPSPQRRCITSLSL